MSGAPAGQGGRSGAGGPDEPAAAGRPAAAASGTDPGEGSKGDVAAKSREVAPGVFELFLPLPSRPTIVNVYLLDCGGEWALIDTGVALADSRAALRGALAELGLDPSAISHLIGTHHHPDHFGASGAIRAESGAAVHLHRRELDCVEGALAVRPEDMIDHFRRHGLPIPKEVTQAPSPAQVWAGTFDPALQITGFLEDGEVLALGRRRLRVVWTPGHTPGHCCLLDLDDRVLFVGDHLLPKITPHVGVYAAGPTNPLGDFLASQEKIGAVDARLVCPAHGPVFRDNHHRAQQIIAHHDYRLLQMRDVIRSGPATAFGVARKAFSWVFEDAGDRFNWGAAIMETLAHLELLRARGLVLAEERDGVVHYRDT